jgi:hypothetical protein
VTKTWSASGFLLKVHLGERKVTAIAAIVRSIEHSPWQINPIFIVLFKPILDPAA